jgi:peptidoglycan/LPS O-acetylase OafA/YrhL
MATVAVPGVESNGAVGRQAQASQVLQIPSLDGLRAVSFLIVFVAHAGVEQFPGGLGVTVFFFLSGFLITTLMRVEVAATGDVSLKNFYLRRALRILPPFYIVLFVATVVGLFAYPSWLTPPLRSLPVLSQVLHFSNYWIAAHGWDGIAPGTGVYWSLAVEEHFYLLFPFAFLLLERRGISGRGKAVVFWGVCAAVFLWRCVLVMGLGSAPDRTYLCSDTRIDSIAFGCALAVWNNPVLDAGPAGPAAHASGKRGAGGLAGRIWFPAGIALLLATLLIRNQTFRETLRYSLQGISLTPIFVAAVARPDQGVFRALNWRPVRFLGTLSYVLYLTHHVVLFALEKETPLRGVPRAVAALVIATGLAWLMHRFVEKPCARLRRRLSALG